MSTAKPLKALIVEDNDDDALLLLHALRQGGFAPDWTRVETSAALRKALDQGPWDIVLSDYSLPQFDGRQALSIVQERRLDIPFIIVSGTIGEEVAVIAIKAGADDFFVKGKLARLPSAIQRELDEVRNRRARRATEHALMASEARLRSVWQNAVDPMRLTDGAGLIQAVNPAFCEWVKKPEPELVGQPFTVAYADATELTLSHYRERFARRTIERFTERKVTLHFGAVACVEMSNAFLESTYGETVLLTSFRDITARKLAEEEVRRQAALLDKARDAVMVCDLAGRISYWNAEAERLFGWTRAEVLGRQPADFLEPLPAEQTTEVRQHTLDQGEWRGELLCETKQGRHLVIDSRWTLIRNEAGQPENLLVMNTDITEQKELQIQHLRTQRLESIGVLAGGIAHDLNNMLVPVLMGANLLRMELKDARSLRLLETIEHSAQHGADLVRQILSFARGVEGSHTELQIAHIIKDLRQLIRNTFPRKITLTVDLDKHLCLVKGSATHLNQLLMNLCVNARDAMSDGGQLTITAHNVFVDEIYCQVHPDTKPGPYVVISVNDTGIGIPAGIRERIFEPFFTTKELGKGTGLGLSTVKGIVKSHEGFIHLYSEPGQGTSFKVYLPALASKEAPVAEPDDGSIPRGQGEMILFVDDDERVRQMVQVILEHYGYRVLPANDGQEGLALFSRHQPEIQLVLTDLMMPNMDGPALIRALRQIQPNLKIIAASGLAEAERLPAELAGIACIPKPFTKKILLDTMNQVLQERGIAGAASTTQA